MTETSISGRYLLLSAIAALVLGVSAARAQPTASPRILPPLRLGVLTDMSSLYADATGPGSVLAAKMAVDDFLAAPHKMSRQIEVISGDHLNKADVAANMTREWIDTVGVDVVIDAPNSSVALAARNIVQQKNRVFLISGASSSDLTGKFCSPNIVHWTYDT